MKCDQCQFELYTPIASSDIVHVGLYDDGRFPGRLIVSLKAHYDDFYSVPLELFSDFMLAQQSIAKSLKQITGAERINQAILGNTVSHVHSHLIPRYSDQELLPEKSPWNDPRPHYLLADKEKVVEQLKLSLKL